MTQGKVKLPREVAEAIEVLRKEYEDSYILWRSNREVSKSNGRWAVLYDYTALKDNLFLLADALRYGYIVDEPITVTITAEQQDWIRTYYKSLGISEKREAIVWALDACGIKIQEVNVR